jgi:hypothetical protein
MIDAAGLINIENKNIGENRYGLNLTTEIEDSDNVSNGIAHFDSGGSYVSNGNTSNNQYGLHVQTYIDSTSHDGTLTNLYGIRSLTGITNSGSNGVVTNNVGYDALVYANDGGTITNSYMYRGGLYGSTPTSIVNNWGLYLTDEEKNYLSGTLGVGAEPTANIIGNFYKNQNSATILNVRNDTNDTGALSELQVRYSTQYGSIIQLSPNYTTNGLLTGNSVGVFSNNNSNGLRVFTYDATDLTLGTNNTSRMAINSVGAISTAFTGTNHSTNGFTSVITDITTSSAAYYTSGLLINATTNYVTSGITNSGEYVGVNSYAFINNADHAGTLTDNFGFNTASGINTCASGGTITNNYGIRCYIYNGAGTMTNSYMFRGIVGTSGGTITNNWGIYLSGCEKNYVEGSLELVGSNVFRVGTPEGSASSDATGLFKFISYGTNQAATNVVLGVLEEDAEANTYLVRMKSGNKTFADATDRFYVNSVGIGYLSSGLGIGVEPTSYALQIQRDQNTATMAFIKNANNNAAAFSGIEIETDSHYSS